MVTVLRLKTVKTMKMIIDNVQTLQEISVPHDTHASPNPTPASVRYENFLKNSLRHLEEMEVVVKKSRKMYIIRDKCKV